MYYIVFARTVNQPVGGYPGQPQGPVGAPSYNMTVVPTLFRAESPEKACQAAARKVGGMGTYFAVEGFPWGVDMMSVEGVSEVGDPAELPQLDAG